MTHFLIVAALGFLLSATRTHILALGFCGVALVLGQAFAAQSLGSFALFAVADVLTVQVGFVAGVVGIELAIGRWPAVFGDGSVKEIDEQSL